MTQNKLQQERNLFYQVELGQVYPRKKSPPKTPVEPCFLGHFTQNCMQNMRFLWFSYKMTTFNHDFTDRCLSNGLYIYMMLFVLKVNLANFVEFSAKKVQKHAIFGIWHWLNTVIIVIVIIITIIINIIIIIISSSIIIIIIIIKIIMLIIIITMITIFYFILFYFIRSSKIWLHSIWHTKNHI